MHRRQLLAGAGAALSAGLAGCRSMFETRSARSPPLVEDRPDAVYYPTHVEGMEMVGRTEAGPYGVALTYSFPHRFWTIDIDRANQVEIRGEDSLHLMATVWDRETGTVVPNSSVTMTVTSGEETVADKSLWPMISQNMGVHAGDNVALAGDGSYEVELDIGPVSARRTGAFADRFGESASATFTLEFAQSTVDDISFERLTDQQGEKGAVEPMQMEMVPVAQLPGPDGMAGTVVGTGTSGGARFVVTRLADTPAGVDADGPYLAVSPQTPYNRYPLPFMALSGTVTRSTTTVFDDVLPKTFDPDLGYHYGAAVDAQTGDDLTVSVDGVPQIARHEGYETAFLSFEDIDLTLSA